MPGRLSARAPLVVAFAIGAVWLASMIALGREPSSPAVGPARAATEPETGVVGPRLRLRSVPELPVRIAPKRRHVRRKRAALVPTATPQAVVTPAAAPPLARPAAPARPKPRWRASGQRFDLSG
jgi:hypothetical protein